MVSSSLQDETNENLKYKLKEPVIRFTYHISHGPFVWRRIRPVVSFGVLQKWINACFDSSLLQGNRHLCRWHVCTKSGLSTLKIAISDMKRAVFSLLGIAFHNNMLCMTYWGPIKEWLSFEGSVVKFHSTENRAFKQKCKNTISFPKSSFPLTSGRKTRAPGATILK